MVIFLTSSFIEYQPKCEYTAKPIDSSNGFTDNLRKYWVDNAKLLVFSSDPADYNMTDHVVTELGDSFTLSGFSVGEIRCFDNRTIDSYRQKVSCQDTGICNALKKDDCPGVDKIAHMALREAMAWADVIFLAGGHAPTENCFMKKCDLKSAIHDSELFDGVVLGLSAGSMNMAENVYLMPELTGESLDENFVRFTNGLGLTDINIVPHLQYESKQMLDGKKLIDEIVAEDSFERKFYMINDGGYFIIRNGVTEFFGDGLIMENGVTRPFYSGIVNPDNSKLFESISSVYYDLTFEIDIESGGTHFLSNQ